MAGGSRSRRWLVLLAALFLFRLGYGLTCELFSEDETQIYLMGLRYHATHAWPYFGPDVVWTQTEIPGALQALVAGLPFDVAPVPEAPYVLLNVISMAALCWFAWYVCARLPSLPRRLVWVWLLTLPWTLNYSTHVMNPSYVLPASLVFFIAFFETIPALRIGKVPIAAAFALQGAAILWVAQVHMSWPLLLPFLGVSFLTQVPHGVRRIAIAAAAFVAGALATGALLIPTLLTYGTVLNGARAGGSLHPHWREPISTIGKTAARILAFSSFEINRFIASGSAKQILFLRQHWWLIPPALFLLVAGIVHPLWMALTAFRGRSAHTDWSLIRWLTVGTVLLVSLGFFFVLEPAQARMYYVVAPVAFMYAAYCWTFIDSPRWRRVAAVVLTVNVIFQAGLALSRLPGSSLYLDRPLVAQAVTARTPDIFSHRRPWAKGVPPEHLASGVIGANTADLTVIRSQLSRNWFGFVSWSVDARNRSTTVAYRDLTCEIIYRDAAGQSIEQHLESIWIVIQPGEIATFQVVDGMRWTPEVASTTVRIVSAQPLQPEMR